MLAGLLTEPAAPGVVECGPSVEYLGQPLFSAVRLDVPDLGSLQLELVQHAHGLRQVGPTARPGCDGVLRWELFWTL
jgi:hypothetical protein